MSTSPDTPSKPARRGVFFYDLLIVGFLAVLAWLYYLPEQNPSSLRNKIPTGVQGLFIECVWIGALGAVMYGLNGVYKHRTDWKDDYLVWHLGRPVTGAIVGGITYLLLRAINPNNEPTALVALAVAFGLGMQEKRFFQFVADVARLFVTVPDEDREVFAIERISPKVVASGQPLTIIGQGFHPAAKVRLGNAELSNLVISPDGTTITGIVPDGTGTVDLLVTNPDGASRLDSITFDAYRRDTVPSSSRYNR